MNFGNDDMVYPAPDLSAKFSGGKHEGRPAMFISRENTEIVSWALQKQAELRTEMVTFYKKDFVEIFQTISEIEPDKEKRQALMRQFVADYQEHWKEAFAMLDMEK